LDFATASRAYGGALYYAGFPRRQDLQTPNAKISNSLQVSAFIEIRTALDRCDHRKTTYIIVFCSAEWM
jgi:hypothetical protein